MSRILVRSAQDPRKIIDATTSSLKMGGNSGNLLYANSAIRALSTSDNVVTAGGFMAHTLDDPSAWLKRSNERFDQYVIPMSNAFRLGFGRGLARMTKIVQGLDMPVTVVGVGAQTSADAAEPGTAEFQMAKTGSNRKATGDEIKRHDEIVHGFVEAVLEKSKTIGVRGEITKRYLESIGIDGDRVDVIGCPSLYTWGPDLRIEKRTDALSSASKISMNIDYRVKGIVPIIERNVAEYRRLTSPSQDTKSARMIISGENQYDMDRFDEGLPIHTGHELYKTRRLYFFPNPWGWIEWMKTQDFVFGNRLHGTIAGLLAGTPAHLLAHDSRTIELAEYHGIPYTMVDAFDEPPTAAELFEQSNFERFNELQPIRFQTYLEFMHRNGLETIFDGKDGAAEFDASIAPGKKVGPVKPALNGWDRMVRKVRGIK